VFHNTRNTAATNLRAGGMDEADAMKITVWGSPGFRTAQAANRPRYSFGVR